MLFKKNLAPDVGMRTARMPVMCLALDLGFHATSATSLDQPPYVLYSIVNIVVIIAWFIGSS